MLRRFVIYLLLLFGALSFATAQPQSRSVSYNTLTPENGLSHITVNSLFQDSFGAIWIATRDGLNCYDGSTIKIFRHDKGNPKSIVSNNVTYIEGDHAGRLYLICNEGVSQLDINTEEFSVILSGSVDAIEWSDGVLYIASGSHIKRWRGEGSPIEEYYALPESGDVIGSLFLDSRGVMWIGTEDSGLFTLEEDGTLKHLVEGANVSTLFEDAVGDIWVGSWSDGLYRFDSSGGKMRNFRTLSGDGNSIASNFVRNITQCDQGYLWLATDRGLCRYSILEDRFERYETTEQNSSLWGLLSDRQGNIWFGTYFGGVSWFNPQYSIYHSYNMVESYRTQLEGAVIGKMLDDKDGLMWICTEGGGVYHYDRAKGDFQQLRDRDGKSLLGDNIKAICYDEQRDIMWFGSHLGGLHRYDISRKRVTNYRYDPSDQWSIPSNIIRDIELYGDYLILGTFNGVAIFDTKSERCERLLIDSQQGRKISIVSNLLIDSSELLWIAVDGGGLYTYDLNSKELNNYRAQKGDPTALSSNNVSTIIEDNNNYIWIGHEGSGVDRFDAESGAFQNFDVQSAGIIGDRVYEICDNFDGTITISTGEGISVLDYINSHSYNYSNKSGYALLSPNENAMYRTHDGVIFVGGVDGLISMNLESLVDIQHIGYTITLSDLYVNQQRVQPLDGSNILSRSIRGSSSITLPSSTSSFSVNFTTSNYIREIQEPILFTLEGFDKGWMEARADQINYTNIAPGRYTLHLRAKSGSENVTPAKLSIEIKPAWYRTLWAWIAYILTLAVIILYLHMHYQQRVQLSSQVRYEQERIEDIERENHAKLQFFTNISHEFRTPLTVIIGQIELLLSQKELSGVSRTKVMSIYKSSSELNLLISELLDFRKRGQGHLPLNVREADISEMMRELYELYREFVEAKGIHLFLKLPEQRVLLNCDIAQLRKVVTNLLSNAIKFSADGDSITLRLSRDERGVVIKVEDSGAGISESDLESIFTRFYQGRSSAQSLMGGTGIGLAFAKSIIDQHGGTIEVSSHLGRGSCFEVILPEDLLPSDVSAAQQPICEVPVVPAPAEPELLPSSLLRVEEADSPYQVTVLIVEDDEQLLTMLSEIFAAQYRVITASDGQEGLSLARERLPQLIVSDVMMPKLSGLELCSEIKNDITTSHIPVVLLTARSATEHAIEGLNSAADDYIVKPFNVNLLLARCNNLVNNRILLQSKFSGQPEENTYKMATSALDQKILERALAIIDRHIDDSTFDIAKFSTEIAMSRTNLFNKIKAVTGLTPNDFILTVRLKRSATLLVSRPELSITEVAESVGFTGYRYFSKRFKERFGISPAAYRREKATAE